ncbi:uncharacterized protein [Amphiura filiformis]|uniref:uncharacterized protein n=1 Tax=Amphiura filiformis TaxID=82378 RepID=UPI003B21C6E5
MSELLYTCFRVGLLAWLFITYVECYHVKQRPLPYTFCEGSFEHFVITCVTSRQGINPKPKWRGWNKDDELIDIDDGPGGNYLSLKDPNNHQVFYLLLSKDVLQAANSGDKYDCFDPSQNYTGEEINGRRDEVPTLNVLPVERCLEEPTTTTIPSTTTVPSTTSTTTVPSTTIVPSTTASTTIIPSTITSTTTIPSTTTETITPTGPITRERTVPEKPLCTESPPKVDGETEEQTGEIDQDQKNQNNVVMILMVILITLLVGVLVVLVFIWRKVNTVIYKQKREEYARSDMAIENGLPLLPVTRSTSHDCSGHVTTSSCDCNGQVTTTLSDFNSLNGHAPTDPIDNV